MSIKSSIKKIINLTKNKQMVPIPESIGLSNCLKGKVALIAGGTGGIGIEIAKDFLSSGAKVIIAGTNEEKLKKTIDELRSDNVKRIVINTLEISSLEDKINNASHLFEEDRIDILVNSFGVMSTHKFMDVSAQSQNLWDLGLRT